MAGVKTKFIFVTGGVVSSLGKGLASASIGALMESRGLKVTLLKMDPYINVDPGTMSPFQHGEVYVTDDGAETDLLGHYERYVSTAMGGKIIAPPDRSTRLSSVKSDGVITSGELYRLSRTSRMRSNDEF